MDEVWEQCPLQGDAEAAAIVVAEQRQRSPRQPRLPLPHVYNSPQSDTAIECSAPAAMLVILVPAFDLRLAQDPVSS